MREILITADERGYLTASDRRFGYGAEHNATVLTFDLSKSAELFAPCDCFRINIDGHLSELLISENSKVLFSVPEECMVPPSVGLQLVGYKLNGDKPSAIIKSNVLEFTVERSEVPCEKTEYSPDIFEKTLAKCEAEASLAEGSAEKAESERIKAEAAAEKSSGEYGKAKAEADKAAASAASSADAATKASGYASAAEKSAEEARKNADKVAERALDLNRLSNALRGKAFGTDAVSVRDVSPIEHDITVKLNSKNLLPYPYYHSDRTVSGITFTDNGDGTITVNGTATDTANFCINLKNMKLSTDKVYVASLGVPDDRSKYLIDVRVGQNYYWTGDLIKPETESVEYVNILIKEGCTLENVVFKPQLEVGTTPTDYTPYVDVSGVTVTETADLNENARVMNFSSPTENVEVTMREYANAACVAAVAPVLKGDVYSGTLTEKAIPVQYSYPESAVSLSVSYSVSGSVVSWNGQLKDRFGSAPISVSGSFDTGDTTVKIIGIEQIYGLDEDNPLYKGYEFDNVDLKLSADYRTGADFDISVYGKNILPYPYVHSDRTVNGITFTDCGDGTITVNGTATAEVEFILSLGNTAFSVGSTYIASTGMTRDHSDEYGLSLQIGDGNYFKDSEVFEAEADTDVYVTIYVRKGCTLENVIFKPQIEMGSVATEYEPYKAPTLYTVNNGVAEIKSFYPSMTLVSGKKNVTADFEYNRDINKAFEELQQAIIGLGGNI